MMTLNKSKIVAALQKIQAAQRLPAEDKNTVLESLIRAMENMGRINGFVGPKGDKGDRGPIGPRGADGKSIKGEKGERGERGLPGRDGLDGQDGQDASVAEMVGIAAAEVQEHEGKHDHKLLHDSKILGPYELDASNAKDGLFLQLQGSKLIFAAPPEVVQQRSWYQSSGSSLTDFFRVRTVTETGNIDPEDRIIHVDATAGDITLTMHTAEGHDRKSHYIKRIDGTANTVTISPTGSETIEFVTTDQLPNQGSGRHYYADSGNWYLLHA